MDSNPKRPRSLKIDRSIISRILLILLVVVMVIFTIWVSGPVPPKDDTRIVTRPYHTAIGVVQSPPASADTNGQPTVPTKLTTEESRIDPEVASDQVTTTGVVFGTIAIVLIVLVGTLFTIWQSKEKKPRQNK